MIDGLDRSYNAGNADRSLRVKDRDEDGGRNMEETEPVSVSAELPRIVGKMRGEKKAPRTRADFAQ
jgi:hypothetical protein